ncbi:MAG: substrate-binding domain-containing protein [Bacillota bacterium]
MKKILSVVVVLALCLTMFAGCGSSDDGTFSGSINVISREDGSGTRGAFTEITGIDDGDGDRTIASAQFISSTQTVITTVADDQYAIGYISLASLSDSVKALQVAGVDATVENVINGSYTIARPFNIALGVTACDAANYFVEFIFSAEGQAIVEEEGGISTGDTGAYTNIPDLTGQTITISGSTSVFPIMEVLTETYSEMTGCKFELSGGGSSTGMKDAMAGTVDIGMASRELKDSESAEVTGLAIAMDGIAVIVNSSCPIDSLSMEEIMNIYIGETTDWDDLV